jgi:hypothetical protein
MNETEKQEILYLMYFGQFPYKMQNLQEQSAQHSNNY